MLLVTGGTGFVGRAVLRRTTQSGYAVRTLLAPSRKSPSLPRGVPVEVALTSLADRRGVRAALVGVDAVIHLAGAGSPGSGLHIQANDVEGTRNLAEAAAEAGVSRLIYLSHLGADRSSAYALQRAKAMAEEHVRTSGVPFTILRSAVLFGDGDHLTTGIAMLLAMSPIVFLVPGDGSALLQPLWVDDMATAIVWALDDPSMEGQRYEIGGPEYFSLKQVIQMVMRAVRRPRLLMNTRPPYLRVLGWLMERMLPGFPMPTPWLDYLAVNRTAALDTLTSVFGLKPARMEGKLGYLEGRRWGWEMIRRQFRKVEGAI